MIQKYMIIQFQITKLIKMQSSGKDNIGESLSNIFERMVSQLDLITNSFTNIDNR